MVFYLTAKDGTLLYVGKDKYENEDLIKWGWPEDIWFHVDNLSSPHVYARLNPGQTIEDVSLDTIRDASQWCKANSIEGCKQSSVVIIYTPWSNLRKDGSMATGQVSFHSDKLVKKYSVLEKDKDTLKRLEKTRIERFPDFEAERKARDDEERAKNKALSREKIKLEKEKMEAFKKDKELRSYDRLFKKDPRDKDDIDDLGLGSLGIKPSEDVTSAKEFEESFM